MALDASPVALLSALVRRDRDALEGTRLLARSRGRRGGSRSLRRQFAKEVITPRLRADTTARLRRHRKLGHTVILASASLDPYVVPLGRLLEVDDVVCTLLGRDRGGRLTGDSSARTAEGPRRLAGCEWLAEAGLGDAVLWAYGDSAGDRELLALADPSGLGATHGARAGAPRLASSRARRPDDAARRARTDRGSHGRRAGAGVGSARDDAGGWRRDPPRHAGDAARARARALRPGRGRRAPRRSSRRSRRSSTPSPTTPA